MEILKVENLTKSYGSGEAKVDDEWKIYRACGAIRAIRFYDLLPARAWLPGGTEPCAGYVCVCIRPHRPCQRGES